ncbi:cobalt-precorrin-6A reductase [soil metagenome]
MASSAKRVLIMGGTTEARELSVLLERAGIGALTSLAGVTRHPAEPAGDLRKGGCGGVSGLKDFLAREQPGAVCDATHPFAAQMSNHVAEATGALGIPLLRLERPPWEAQPGDNWQVFNDISAAVEGVPRNSRVFLTIGRKEAPVFFARSDITGVARMIEPLESAAPRGWRIILQRPPYSYGDELNLMRKQSFTVLVTKNSGGGVMRAKLDAARAIGCPVIMIARPNKPKAATEAAPEAAAARLASMLSA